MERQEFLVRKKSRGGSGIQQYINLLTDPNHNKQVAEFKQAGASQIQQWYKTQERLLYHWKAPVIVWTLHSSYNIPVSIAKLLSLP